MSQRTSPVATAELPPLVAGQRLDQPTFHARYEAMPPGTRAELINGVVYMPSPVGFPHGDAHADTIMWLGYYRENTPGVKVADNATAILGPLSEPQPDASLRILPEYGGRTWTEGDYMAGAPELLAEISHSSRSIDLGPKFDDYQRAGVLEYIVRAIGPDELLWFVLRDGRFVELEIGGDGIYRSEAFPGLWLDPSALLTDDVRRVRAVLDQGRATPEHAAFVARLAENKARTEARAGADAGGPQG